ILATGVNAETRIARADIAELRPGTVSVMPQGLDEQLSKQELADLLAFLKDTRWGEKVIGWAVSPAQRQRCPSVRPIRGLGRRDARPTLGSVPSVPASSPAATAFPLQLPAIGCIWRGDQIV